MAARKGSLGPRTGAAIGAVRQAKKREAQAAAACARQACGSKPMSSGAPSALATDRLGGRPCTAVPRPKGKERYDFGRACRTYATADVRQSRTASLPPKASSRAAAAAAAAAAVEEVSWEQIEQLVRQSAKEDFDMSKQRLLLTLTKYAATHGKLPPALAASSWQSLMADIADGPPIGRSTAAHATASLAAARTAARAVAADCATDGVQPRETAAEVAVAGAAETAAEGAAAGAAEAAAERAAVRVAEPEAIERALVGLLDSYAHKAAGTRGDERALLEHAAYKARVRRWRSVPALFASVGPQCVRPHGKSARRMLYAARRMLYAARCKLPVRRRRWRRCWRRRTTAMKRGWERCGTSCLRSCWTGSSGCGRPSTSRSRSGSCFASDSAWPCPPATWPPSLRRQSPSSLPVTTPSRAR